MDPSSVKRRLTCILAADAVGYSKQMGQDEEGTIRVLAAHRSVIDGIIAFHQGRIVSTAGDSVLAEFGSVVEAVRCAVEIQEALKTRNDSLPEHRQMHFRVGVNLGDVVVKNDDLLGDGVNVAARLETIAQPGGICISSSVYDQITGKLDLSFQDIGEQTLKNVSRPIRVYRVSGAAAPVRPAVSPPPARRASSARNPVRWVVGGLVAAVIVVAAAWQSGWVRFGPAERASTAMPPAVVVAPPPPPAAEAKAPPSAVVETSPPRAQVALEAQRLRTEAEAIRRQVQAELGRARADAEANRAARTQAEADATAARLRAQADAATAAPATLAADKGSSPASAARFDGTWNVTTVCQKHPDGAAGYTIKYVAEVKDGFLRGTYGSEGAASSLLLQGAIQPDGSAKLDAKGLTGDSKFNPKGTGVGVPYGYQVAAQFEGTRGTGRASLVRGCDLTFVKQ